MKNGYVTEYLVWCEAVRLLPESARTEKALAVAMPFLSQWRLRFQQQLVKDEQGNYAVANEIADGDKDGNGLVAQSELEELFKPTFD